MYSSPLKAFAAMLHIGLALLFLLALVLQVITVLEGCSSTNTNPASSIMPEGVGAVVSSDNSVQHTLELSCFDCHSDNNSAPWNVRVAPSYLFGTTKAREALNFSAWRGYSPSRMKDELEAISKVVEDGSMPPWDYDLLHPSGRLTDEQRLVLLQWVSHKPAQTGP